MYLNAPRSPLGLANWGQEVEGSRGRGVEGSTCRGVEGRWVEPSRGRGSGGQGSRVAGRGVEGRGVEGRGVKGRGVEGREVEGRRGGRVEGGGGKILSIFGPKWVKNRPKIHSKSIQNCIATDKFKYRRLEIEKRGPRTVRHRRPRRKRNTWRPKFVEHLQKIKQKFIKNQKRL